MLTIAVVCGAGIATSALIAQQVRDAGEATAQGVRDYEGRHQRRVEVLEAASQQLSGSSS